MNFLAVFIFEVHFKASGNRVKNFKQPCKTISDVSFESFDCWNRWRLNRSNILKFSVNFRGSISYLYITGTRLTLVDPLNVMKGGTRVENKRLKIKTLGIRSAHEDCIFYSIEPGSRSTVLSVVSILAVLASHLITSIQAFEYSVGVARTPSARYLPTCNLDAMSLSDCPFHAADLIRLFADSRPPFFWRRLNDASALLSIFLSS